MASLPMFFSLKSETMNKNNRYLRYVHQEFDEGHGLLQLSGEEVVSPYTKFHAEMASVNQNQVNIQSCYNNKYLMRADKQEDKNPKGWIVAWADDKQEDPRLQNCTLFEPISEGAQIKLRHVQSLAFLKIPGENECLFVSPDSSSLFTVIDWNELVILPKHLAFKGDNEDDSYIGDMYLEAKSMNGYPLLEFYADEPIYPTVQNEVFTAGDGSVRIYSTHYQKFWRLDSNHNNWILADSNDTTNLDSDTLFWPEKVNKNTDEVSVVVALRNLGNKNFCGGSPLNASFQTRTPEACLVVKELVQHRTINILKFRRADARIYNRNTDVVLITREVENRTQQPASATIQFSYTSIKTSTWNTSTKDIAFTSLIPTTLISDTLFVVDDRIEVSNQFNGPYQWGDPYTTAAETPFDIRVDLPSMTKKTVSLLATTASCDIPFDYIQNDNLFSEMQPTITYHVGVYTGVSFSNFHHKEEPKPLGG